MSWKSTKQERQLSATHRLLPWAALVLVAWLLSQYVVQLMLIQGSSMEPTYSPWQLTVVCRLDKAFAPDKVVAFQVPGVSGVLVKRIAAGPGDKVEIREGVLYRNGEPQLTQLDPMTDPGLAAQSILLGEGQYFVLGDNRNHSIDSRFEEIGVVGESQIIGTVWPQRPTEEE